ncbi:MAG: threonine--tRNA ligase [Candidatus Zambryskibacteria bacterium]|nr:threonine--tRNA ligase [Candidatus Zambryskibacteria bacterium]
MEKENLGKIRHSLAHLLASAVLDLYPDTLVTLGPAIDTGFYYDFEFKKPVSEKDFQKIEKKMRETAKSWKGFEKSDLSFEEAKKLFAGNPYKLELIKEINERNEQITTQKSGDFVDLCRGGHIDDMSKIPAGSWKLDRIAGAYWRGDEKNKMLTRIYGLAFESKKDLDAYILQQEEAKKRDHRKLGKELDLFTFSDYIGSGLPLYTPRGTLIRRLLNEYIEELQTKENYTQVWTPQIAKAELFKISGHYNKYKDDMFKVVSNYSDEEFFLKPMNCPQHTQIYASQPRSYRDLPLRYTDFAMLYRDERPGELSGLARVRSFSQDDCHIFCREDQIDQEVDVALDMTKKVMATFGFKYRYRLSTRDPKKIDSYLGDPKTWDRVEKWAEDIMKRHKIEYFDGPGEAAFYAPKMDLLVTDAIGREWQLSTVQIDFVMPERFDLKYTDKDGKEKRPVMLHRAIIGSPERFIMILIENYSGNFPLWLSPVQVKVIPVRTNHNEYAKKIFDLLKENNIRAELDNEDKNLGGKVRDAKNQKIPYWIVIGDKEVEADKVTLESRDAGQVGQISKEELVSKFSEEIKNKK